VRSVGRASRVGRSALPARVVAGTVRGRRTAATMVVRMARTSTTAIVRRLVSGMLRKRLTSDKHGTTCPHTHHPGVAEGPCSWSPPLRRRQDRAGPRTVAPGPNGRLVRSREKYARRRRRSGPVGGLSGTGPVGRFGGAGSASRREGRRGEEGSAGPFSWRTEGAESARQEGRAESASRGDLRWCGSVRLKGAE